VAGMLTILASQRSIDVNDGVMAKLASTTTTTLDKK
jgi:hypothetical protein